MSDALDNQSGSGGSGAEALDSEPKGVMALLPGWGVLLVRVGGLSWSSPL